MFDRRKGKVVKVKLPKGSEVLLSYEARSEDTGYLGTYLIEALPNLDTPDIRDFIGHVTIERPSGRAGYVIKRLQWKNAEYLLVGEKQNPIDADSLAYATATQFAEKIAEYNKVPLEDSTLEDKTRSEEEGLIRKIDSFPNKDVRLGIFGLTILAGVTLTVYSFSPTATGNIISDAPILLQNLKSLFGIFLFVFGLVGLVFNFRKKK